MLNKDLSEKDGEVRNMEMRWKNVQEENRILIEELSEKRKYLDDLLSKNISLGQEQNNQQK